MKQITIDKNEENSLMVLIDYLEYSETKHYEECDDETKRNHVYTHVEQLKSLLKKAKAQARC